MTNLFEIEPAGDVIAGGDSFRKRGSQTLRGYQHATVEAVLTATDPMFGDGLTRVLYVLATGTGKTTVFSEIIARLLEMGHPRILVIAHRIELIGQAYKRIKDHCQLRDSEIGQEIAETHAPLSCKVIVGSVQTCMGGNRPHASWRPTVIICDESHHASAASYRKICDRYGVERGECLHIGCTATAKRTDKFSLYAETPDGSPVEIAPKKGPKRPATHEDSVFQRLVFEYTPLDAMEDGWLVSPTVYTVRTETNLDRVGMSRNGDFEQGQLEEAVDNTKRTQEVIAAWKRDLPHAPPTLVFCAGVEHAHHAAELWRQAGYTAEAVDGTTDSFTRQLIFKNFMEGKLNVLTNFGIATEGTDLPNCACIVNLRPTKSWTLFVQMQGRGLRPLPGVLDGIDDDPELRRGAIATSAKKSCAIIDVVDLYSKHDICTAPAILDLPVKLDMQGHSLTEAKKMLDKFKEVKDRVIGECPVTYQDLEARLEQVDVMRRSGAKSEPEWKVTEKGSYRFTKVPPQCHVELLPTADGYRLVVDGYGKRLLDKTGEAGHDMKSYLDKAREHAERVLDEHRVEMPKGTLSRLSKAQVNVLCHYNGHKREEVDSWTYGYAKTKIGEYITKFKQGRDGNA